MGTREDIVRAVTDGAAAGRRGDDVRTCPYPRDSLLRTAWVKGYAKERPATATR
ncbi:Rmf/CrpP fold protein [Streptomyces sp. CB02959]|uniref:Rmf/CrpP fold protein n=1 Tax=Streptomyces sp. CB02959 TaxID=2020330 RepID=UPI00268E6EA3|nr:Rmf/CrpP fold protein [Streptomyces sp. CB02959]